MRQPREHRAAGGIQFCMLRHSMFIMGFLVRALQGALARGGHCSYIAPCWEVHGNSVVKYVTATL
jgi:hypothetical protein